MGGPILPEIDVFDIAMSRNRAIQFRIFQSQVLFLKPRPEFWRQSTVEDARRSFFQGQSIGTCQLFRLGVLDHVQNPGLFRFLT